MNSNKLIRESFDFINQKQKGLKGRGKAQFDINIAVRTKDRERYYQLLRDNEKSLITLCLLVQAHIQKEYNLRLDLQTVSLELMKYLGGAWYDANNQ